MPFRPSIHPLLGALALLAATAAGAAEPALTPAQKEALQARLEAAVVDHDQGRLLQAREAFEGLARAGLPAADYNLAVMNLRGEGGRPAPAEARRRLERAAGAGFVSAQAADTKLPVTFIDLRLGVIETIAIADLEHRQLRPHRPQEGFGGGGSAAMMRR